MTRAAKVHTEAGETHANVSPVCPPIFYMITIVH